MLWLSTQTGKALLKLDDRDFREHHLHELLDAHGPAQSIAHRVFLWMMNTIEYHPGGRDPKRVICFSPHPDDDVISMGGALIRLVEDKHEVHVAYMTSGNIAVFDHDARRVADLVIEFNRLFGIEERQSLAIEEHVCRTLADKKPGEPDSETVLKIKALIRWSEAKAGAMSAAARSSTCTFSIYRSTARARSPRIRSAPTTCKSSWSSCTRSIRSKSISPATCPTRTARTAFVPRQSSRQCISSRPRPAIGPRHCFTAGRGRNGRARDRDCGPLEPAGFADQERRHLPARVAERFGMFPGSDSREFWQRAKIATGTRPTSTTNSDSPNTSPSRGRALERRSDLAKAESGKSKAEFALQPRVSR